MPRDHLLLSEMIEAAERGHQLTDDVTVDQLQADEVPWQQPGRLRNHIVHGYWSIDMEILHTTATEQLPAFGADLGAVHDALPAEPEDPDQERG